MALELTRLTFTAASNQPGTASAVTILVGPNNSGKSLALREIEAWARGSNNERFVINEVDVSWPSSAADAIELVRPFIMAPAPGEALPEPGSVLLAPFRIQEAGQQGRTWLPRSALDQQLHVGQTSDWLRSTLLLHFVARLDGRTRFELLQQRSFQDEQIPPQHHLAALFFDEEARSRVRDIVEEAFPGRFFVIDPTAMTQFRVGMSSRPPEDPGEEAGWDKRARDFHAKIEHVETLSDGVVCFTGLIAAAMSLPHRILLIDEPEAFLHPPLARLLGANLGTLTRERGASLVAATHSAEFLMGCIESGTDTTIVRLTYEGGVAGARVLAPAGLTGLIRDPLLRSTDALSGLFHRGVVVGEADADRAFYNEINRRLVAIGRGTADTFFTNAQNWQTIARVVGPLRQLGVPAAAILDLDTLTGRKREWEKFYNAAGLETATSRALETKRARVSGSLKALGKEVYKSTGLARLAQTDRTEAQELLQDLESYGVFVVEKGELENWLVSLGVRTKKATWIVDIFRALGSTPGAASYVAPGTGDVWAFVDRVGKWVSDPNRAGMPE
jgi:hypothetical protein